MSHDNMDYIDILRSNGFRVTRQRTLIMDAVCGGQGHTTFGEIYARTKEMDTSIDRSTVYRTLDLLIKVGLVVSADIGKAEKVYEISKARAHHHLVCQECGNVLLVQSEIVKSLFDDLERQYQFAITMDHLVIFGVCSTCERDR